jgi:HK97 family phage major capsid protein
MNPVKMREERARLLGELRSIVDATADREPTAEDRQAFDRLEERIGELDGDIRRAENASGLLASAELARDAARREAEGEERGSDAGAEYRAAFRNYLVSGAVTPELRAQVVGTAASGGYLAPESFQARLFEALEELGTMASRVETVTTGDGRSIEWPTLTDDGDAAWTAEAAAFNEDDLAFGVATIDAHKATRLVKVSEELLSDSVLDVANLVATKMGESFGRLFNTAIMVGDGSSKPDGIVPGATVGVTAAGAAAITADELIDLEHSVALPYRTGAIFVVRDATVKLLRKLKDSDGRYLWNDSMVAGVPTTLLGYPVVTDPDMPAVAASARTIMFGNVRRAYLFRRVSTIGVQRLNELYSANGLVGFRAFMRVDGVIQDVNAVRVLAQAAA